MVRIDFNRLRFLVIDDNAHMWPAPIEWSGGHVSLRLGAVPA